MCVEVIILIVAMLAGGIAQVVFSCGVWDKERERELGVRGGERERKFPKVS